ncbi:MAG: hypothetical protein ACREGR_03080 [Minisyncoccia bacterium]
MRFALLALALLAPFIFPWPLAALLTLAAAFFFPLAPLAVGALAEALYYAHGAYSFPLFLTLGVFTTLLALFVHRFVETSIMRP